MLRTDLDQSTYVTISIRAVLCKVVRQAMRHWIWGIAVVEIVLFLGGWGLVSISGHGGNRLGGSALVWQVGGIMVYAAVLLMPLAVLGVAGLGVAHHAAGPLTTRDATAHLRPDGG